MRRIRWAAVALWLVPSARAQWVPQASGTTAEFRGLSVVDASVAWVSGTKGRYARTTDGGVHWRVDSIAGAGSLDLRAIHAIGARVAWAMSAGEAEKGLSRIFQTRDGGSHWELQYSTSTKGVFLDALAFWDARHGIAVSDPVDGRLFILTTTDGGSTWVRVPPDRLPAVLPREAAFAASGSCLAVQGARNVWIGTGGGGRARVFRSTDRGEHWTVADTPVRAGGPSAGIFSIAFRDALHGVVVGGDYRRPQDSGENVAVTRDGGHTWMVGGGATPAGYMSAVAFVPGTRRGWVAVGPVGTALSADDGGAWRMVDTTAYNSVRFVAQGGTGFAAGPAGRVARWRGDR
ncbi:MAG: oxidoreductase [Gemmatimonadaceae bacterium]